MRDLNKVMLIGNLTRDPEIRTIPSGQNVASFAIATNRRWNDASGELQTAVEYTDIVAWGKLAEIAGQILKKGRRTYIEGRLQTRSYDVDAVTKYTTEIIANQVQFLGGKNDEQQQSFGDEPSNTPAKEFNESPAAMEPKPERKNY